MFNWFKKTRGLSISLMIIGGMLLTGMNSAHAAIPLSQIPVNLITIYNEASFDNQTWIINEITQQAGHGTPWTQDDLNKVTQLDSNFRDNYDLSGYKIPGQHIPSAINLLPNLQTIRLTDIQLTGSIPSLNLPNLQVLDLSNNQLKGDIPNLNLPNLEQLSVSSNQLTGTIPSLNLPKLQFMDLSNNQFTGSIPSFNLPQLQSLNLSSNRLSGSLSSINFPYLQYLNLSVNQLTGSIPNYNLPNLQDLVLSSNQLSGSIPNFNLPQLQSLGLSSNLLTGAIPNFNLPSLKFLNLSRNQLSGEIPNLQLPALGLLNLSNNQLTGHIPKIKLNDQSVILIRFTNPLFIPLDLSFNQLTGSGSITDSYAGEGNYLDHTVPTVPGALNNQRQNQLTKIGDITMNVGDKVDLLTYIKNHDDVPFSPTLQWDSAPMIDRSNIVKQANGTSILGLSSGTANVTLGIAGRSATGNDNAQITISVTVKNPGSNSGSGVGSGVIITPPQLEKEHHIAYIEGYPGELIKPDHMLTRAEVAAIFFRLLKDQSTSGPQSRNFDDVQTGTWYAAAVNCLASFGIIDGYEDGSFRPNASITRAEFTAIASRFSELKPPSGQVFKDVAADYWAAKYINSAYQKGWIAGYSDGTFKPNQPITRAETIKIVNRMLERQVDPAKLETYKGMFKDISNHWALGDIIEAAVGHEFDKFPDGTEHWK